MITALFVISCCICLAILKVAGRADERAEIMRRKAAQNKTLLEDKMMSVQSTIVHITDEEKTKFLAGAQIPEGDDQAYIWFAVDNSVGGVLYLFPDELPIAAEMARNVGLEDLAQKMEKAVQP